MSDPDRLDEVRQRRAAITPPPWRWGDGRARSAGRVVSRRILNHGPDMQRRLHPKVEASYAPGTKASTPALSRRIPLGCETSPATTAALGFYRSPDLDR